MIKPFKVVVAAMLCALHASAQDTDPARYPLIPYPQEISTGAGNFYINKNTHVVSPAIFANELKQLQGIFTQYTGKALSVAAKAANGTIVLVQNKSITGEEEYTLDITPERVTLAARTSTGIFRGIETIRQLLPLDAREKGAFFLPAAHIKDHPMYGWRGMHLDVARHFFSISYVKKYIDRLALYKMNKLHLHLTDDQGWRIEIKKYPLLTQNGAWREYNNQDSVCIEKSKDNPDMALDTEHIIHKNGKTLYGGFYTQAQMRDIIAYAAARHVEIIPEIDMPGHMMMAIKSYPFLACSTENGWGKTFSTPICPCNESTFKFAEDVFTEIAALFPSQYIHLGADEVEKTSWEKAPQCAEVMKANNLKTVEELQSYFVKRMEKFFNSKGKKLIGWDEILEGGISPTAVLMYWRSWVPKAPIEAAKHGNKVIMTPGNPLYFDGVPDRNSISNVYHFEPVPKALTAEEAKFIIGAQANLWTEWIASEKRADYMVMPRMTALAEVLWTHQQRYDSYLQRLNTHYTLLDDMGVHYRMPDLEGFTEDNVFVDKGKLEVIKPALKGITVRYTTDGSIPDANATELTGSLEVTRPETIKLAAFSRYNNRGDIYTLKYRQQNYLQPVSTNGVQNGLQLDYFKGTFKSVTKIKQDKDSTMTTPNMFIPVELGQGGKPFGAKLHGYIDVPETGIYSFYLTVDDGGILYIGDNEVVNNDGWHAPMQKSGQAALQKGLHPVLVSFVEGGGGFTLKLEYSLNGGKILPVPDSWYKH
ncbi:family 20 glycosylhydrolase [Chitinophaga sp. Cy-1792]|uniref:family 20 glycosylhydrolase n=1 Tax=Chitinophaga sp. Cy-1792 TaxID=2608339 RepID=UPI001420D897|nr:family 20 glycosylhydrolase [Chitinophaga sp. Cy-1792]NIG55819.1 family 20 glycosylhydrolase [Chitinophaga sp. Cy-1792]